jgi:hypothetical protein
MADAEEKLARAMAQASPAARDPAFVLAVLERAEHERFRRGAVQSLLRGVAATAAVAALAILLGEWAAAHADALLQGAVWAAALITLFAAARAASARLSALG